VQRFAGASTMRTAWPVNVDGCDSECSQADWAAPCLPAGTAVGRTVGLSSLWVRGIGRRLAVPGGTADIAEPVPAPPGESAV